MPTLTLTPPLPKKPPYEIVVEAGAMKKIQEYIDHAGNYDAAFVLYDARMKEAAAHLKAAITIPATLIPVPSGEESKSLQEVEHIVRQLIEDDATRQSIIINCGGGMLTDLGGFVAATFMRGIATIHVPTTLLGMVDAAIGGKTGVDLGAMKNIVGAYHHPRAVVCDLDFLKTLPDEHLRQGLVEVVKIAAIEDCAAFEWLEANLNDILTRDEEVLSRCILQAAGLKGRVVAEDEQDEHRRMFLNFGHTVGHAVETLSQFTIPHGDAVSIGMVAEMRITKTQGAQRVEALLQAMNRPTEIPRDMNFDELWKLMEHDKKAKNGVRIAAATSIGSGDMRLMTKDQFLSLQS